MRLRTVTILFPLVLLCLIACTAGAPSPQASQDLEPLTQVLVLELSISPTLVVPSSIAVPSASSAPSKPVKPPTEPFIPTNTASVVTPNATVSPPRLIPTRVQISLTPSPVPRLSAHEWKPDWVLVSVSGGGGDGCCTYPSPPRFILYADGQVIIDGAMTTQLDRKSRCAILNTLDQIGFLDYDDSTYPPPAGYYLTDGAGSSIFRVNAWRSNTARAYGLGTFLTEYDPAIWGEDPGFPTILPAIRDTYWLFKSFQPTNLKRYEPKKVAVFAGSPVDEPASLNWPLQEPTLADVSRESAGKNGWPEKPVVLKGEAARKLSDVYDQSNPDPNSGFMVNEDGLTYPVFIRPLLPLEEPPSLNSYTSQIPYPGAPQYPKSLSCFPSDGVLPIPTPIIHR